jgi:hypothetical protein
MAVSKNTRNSDSDTNKLFQTFQSSQVSEERERAWREAVRHAGTGTSPLRFSFYKHLYFVYAQKLVDLLRELIDFSHNRETSLYHQSSIQYVRAVVSRDLLESMAGIEHTDAWLFESQRKGSPMGLCFASRYIEARRGDLELIRNYNVLLTENEKKSR